MRRKALIVALAVTAGLALTACGGDEDEPASGEPAAEETATGQGSDGATVTLKTFQFEPSPLTVDAGTTVTFNNEDDILHTVVAGKRGDATGEFDEDLDGAGTSAEITFDEPGTIDYNCDIHQGMDGQVIVE